MITPLLDFSLPISRLPSHLSFPLSLLLPSLHLLADQAHAHNGAVDHRELLHLPLFQVLHKVPEGDFFCVAIGEEGHECCGAHHAAENEDGARVWVVGIQLEGEWEGETEVEGKKRGGKKREGGMIEHGPLGLNFVTMRLVER